jgi:hypothetical protein
VEKEHQYLEVLFSVSGLLYHNHHVSILLLRSVGRIIIRSKRVEEWRICKTISGGSDPTKCRGSCPTRSFTPCNSVIGSRLGLNIRAVVTAQPQPLMRLGLAVDKEQTPPLQHSSTDFERCA